MTKKFISKKNFVWKKIQTFKLGSFTEEYRGGIGQFADIMGVGGGGGVGKKEGGGGFVFLRGVDAPMHTMINA